MCVLKICCVTDSKISIKACPFTMVHKTFGAKYPHEQIESRAGEFLVNLHDGRVGLMAIVWSQRIGKYTIIAV